MKLRPTKKVCQFLDHPVLCARGFFACSLLETILAQYRHIGSTSANITILGQCWCDVVVPM